MTVTAGVGWAGVGYSMTVTAGVGWAGQGWVTECLLALTLT